MKNTKASTILLSSAFLEFIAGVVWRFQGSNSTIVDFINLIGLLLLLWGAIKWDRERRGFLDRPRIISPGGQFLNELDKAKREQG